MYYRLIELDNVSSFLNGYSCCCAVDHEALLLVLVALSLANLVDHEALALVLVVLSLANHYFVDHEALLLVLVALSLAT